MRTCGPQVGRQASALPSEYEDSNPSKIRLDDNPSEITAIGSLRVAFYFFLPGMLLMLTSRSERFDAR
jgi:hypothetical protein